MASSPVSVATWAQWRTVGCGVECLHEILVNAGARVTLEEALREALALDGYADDVGWRHRSLVAVARNHGVRGEVEAGLTVARLTSGVQWMVSVRAPEQFEFTHLVVVTRIDAGLHVFWPQVHPRFGERFAANDDWLAARMTGRGMSFAVRRVAPFAVGDITTDPTTGAGARHRG